MKNVDYPNGKINLLKFRNSFIVKAGNEQKIGVFIPIEENMIFTTRNEDGTIKGAYFDFIAFKNQKPMFDYEYGIKQSISKKRRDEMPEDERKNIPYLGNMNIPTSTPAVNTDNEVSRVQTNHDNAVYVGSQDEEDNLPF